MSSGGSLDFDVYCRECGEQLDVYSVDIIRNSIGICVEPCSKCIAEKTNEIQSIEKEFEETLQIASDEIEDLKDQIEILRNSEVFINIEKERLKNFLIK